MRPYYKWTDEDHIQYARKLESGLRRRHFIAIVIVAILGLIPPVWFVFQRDVFFPPARIATVSPELAIGFLVGFGLAAGIVGPVFTIVIAANILLGGGKDRLLLKLHTEAEELRRQIADKTDTAIDQQPTESRTP